jgi:hypothetical protein
MTAFDPATEALLNELAPPPARNPAGSAKCCLTPPAENHASVLTFIAARLGNRYLRHPITLAEDLRRVGLWPTADQSGVELLLRRESLKPPPRDNDAIVAARFLAEILQGAP